VEMQVGSGGWTKISVAHWQMFEKPVNKNVIKHQKSILKMK
jgi:hypothetical protein